MEKKNWHLVYWLGLSHSLNVYIQRKQKGNGKEILPRKMTKINGNCKEKNLLQILKCFLIMDLLKEKITL